MRGQPTLFTVVVSPKDPPRGTPRPWGCCLPERTLRGVRVWWLPWVPTEAMGWTVGTRGHLAGSCRRFADPRPPGSLTPAWHTRDGFFRNGGPGQSAAGHGRAGEHPVVDRRSSPGSWSRLRWLVLLVGQAQQDLQLLGAAPGGQDLCGGLQPAQHEHGQGRCGRVVGVDWVADPSRLPSNQLRSSVQQPQQPGSQIGRDEAVNRMSWPRGMPWPPRRSDSSAQSLATSAGASSPRRGPVSRPGSRAQRLSSRGNPMTPLHLRGRPSHPASVPAGQPRCSGPGWT
jgi:hypothetical protein